MSVSRLVIVMLVFIIGLVMAMIHPAFGQDRDQMREIMLSTSMLDTTKKLIFMMEGVEVNQEDIIFLNDDEPANCVVRMTEGDTYTNHQYYKMMSEGRMPYNQFPAEYFSSNVVYFDMTGHPEFLADVNRQFVSIGYSPVDSIKFYAFTSNDKKLRDLVVCVSLVNRSTQ